jgi:hypothetical protein
MTSVSPVLREVSPTASAQSCLPGSAAHYANAGGVESRHFVRVTSHRQTSPRPPFQSRAQPTASASACARFIAGMRDISSGT